MINCIKKKIFMSSDVTTNFNGLLRILSMSYLSSNQKVDKSYRFVDYRVYRDAFKMRRIPGGSEERQTLDPNERNAVNVFAPRSSRTSTKLRVVRLVTRRLSKSLRRHFGRNGY